MGNLWHHIEGVMTRISKTNALYPLLIALFFVILFASIVLYVTDNILMNLGALVLVGMVVYQIMKSYTHFSVNNPEMLRSETMIIQKKALDLLGDERGLEACAEDVISIVNPRNPIQESDLLTDGAKNYE